MRSCGSRREAGAPNLSRTQSPIDSRRVASRRKVLERLRRLTRGSETSRVLGWWAYQDMCVPHGSDDTEAAKPSRGGDAKPRDPRVGRVASVPKVGLLGGVLAAVACYVVLMGRPL